MSSKQIKESGKVGEMRKEEFRPNFVIDTLAGVDKEPGFLYKGVIYNYPHLPHNVNSHEKEGYEVVYDKKPIEDDRLFSPNQNVHESSTVAPVLGRTKDGYTYVVMRISEDKAKENEKRKAKAYEERRLASVGGTSIERHGDTIHIKGSTINFDPHKNSGDN